MSNDELDEYSPLLEEGCLFPGECCMPGLHYTCECHTADDLMSEEEEAFWQEVRTADDKAYKEWVLKQNIYDDFTQA